MINIEIADLPFIEKCLPFPSCCKGGLPTPKRNVPQSVRGRVCFETQAKHAAKHEVQEWARGGGGLGGA